jgi:hypothetical protein
MPASTRVGSNFVALRRVLRLAERGKAQAGRFAGVCGTISPCRTFPTLLYLLFPRGRPCWRSSTAEQRFCKPQVVSSILTASSADPSNGARRDASVWWPRRFRARTIDRTNPDPRGLKSITGRWPSGQWHQTVNLTSLSLRGFESLPAHSKMEEIELRV